MRSLSFGVAWGVGQRPADGYPDLVLIVTDDVCYSSTDVPLTTVF